MSLRHFEKLCGSRHAGRKLVMGISLGVYTESPPHDEGLCPLECQNVVIVVFDIVAKHVVSTLGIHEKCFPTSFSAFFFTFLQTAHQTTHFQNSSTTHYVTKGMLCLDRQTFKQKILLENSRKHARTYGSPICGKAWAMCAVCSRPKFYPAYNKLFLHLKRDLLSHFG